MEFIIDSLIANNLNQTLKIDSMDPEVTNMMNALAEESFNKWKESATAEQKAV